MTESTLHPMILSAMQLLDSQKSRIAARMPDLLDAETTAAEFPQLHPSIFVAECSAYLDVVVDSMDQVVPLLRSLAAKGYRIGARVDKPDSSECVWRTHAEDDRRVYLTVHLAGTLCKYEKVGEQMTPVYELKCGRAP